MTIHILTIAAFSIVWIYKIISPSGLLSWLPGKLIRMPEKVRHVLFICPSCLAGQLAFWSYFLILPYWNPFEHFAFITWSIFAAFIFDLVIEILIELRNKLSR